ncbi:MAG TPA: hypothetical protein VN457_02660 [Chlamydiales bacterium]|nr:hypothetical protein [Chlamydiales bacterium]
MPTIPLEPSQLLPVPIPTENGATGATPQQPINSWLYSEDFLVKDRSFFIAIFT